ncbi:MAG TPA: M14 family zinc carboxypeptidase [Longimicrobiaceae bacterium]|nr:M14 family zinc carboxypeptidase [Longimicrobiaceae bacterium]
MYQRTVRRRTLPALLALALPAGTAAAQTAPPSPAQFLGYEMGEHFTPYSGVRDYSRALAEASPLVEYRPYGTTPERRELFQLVIASPENLRRLDAILAANAELTRPETPVERARQIATSNPAVVYFSYGVHGNESSSPEAAMWTAWDLARGAPEVAGVLDSLVVVIDPVTNPDGRDRYVQWFNSVVGERPDPDPQSREHREPWPGGRFNHYLFDLNRDWSWGTQPETRARLATWTRWNPQVHVDFHEMFYNSSYFFFPASAPINPIYPEYVLRWGKRFGEGNAHAFDARGWEYYTAEAFDLFYPGYGDSWPSLTGAIGMTYEQAGHGAAGLAIRREDGDTLTLRERAEHHRTAGLATLRTAAAGKSTLLLDYASGHRTVGEDSPDFLLVPGTDPGRVEALVAHLRSQGIEVERASQGFGARATAHPGFEARSQFPAGTYRVRARQPRGRLAITLLQPETQLRAEYSYDVSAWSLPYAYGVAGYRVGSTPAAGWTPVPAPAGTQASPAPPAPGYGYLVTPGPGVGAQMVRFLERGGRARVLAKPSTFGGRRFPAGTWFLPSGGNDSLQARVAAAGLGGAAVPVRSGLSEDGVDLGSENVMAVRHPRVAVVGGEGVSATSFGAYWYFLEQELGLRFDAVLAGDLPQLDLSQYDVVVVPDAFGRALGKPAQDALKAWVERGGRLVAVAGAAVTVAAMAEIKTRSEDPDSAKGGRERYLAGREQREREDWQRQVPGTILPLRLDPAHPLAWGAGVDNRPDRGFALHEGMLAFEPAEGVETVAYFPKELARISGVISPENLTRLQEGAWLVTKRMGRGSVVLFADDPLFRLFWRASQPMFVNALLLTTVP